MATAWPPRSDSSPRPHQRDWSSLSGYGQAEDRDRSRAAGFDLHLTKPLDSEELMQLLTTGPLIPPG